MKYINATSMKMTLLDMAHDLFAAFDLVANQHCKKYIKSTFATRQFKKSHTF